ncbi:large repetitive protein [Enterococcus sp. DIV2379]|uniref:immunoglobulin-like domain-containing protein n=1 Tax=Enterococcus sp. DIV2379 TaxID=2774684 RepID=UPI003D2FBCA3
MNNKFSKKVTGLLLISHLTLSTLPITAFASDESAALPEVQIESTSESSMGQSGLPVLNPESNTDTTKEDVADPDKENAAETTPTEETAEQEAPVESEGNDSISSITEEETTESIQARNIQDAHVRTTEEFISALQNSLIRNIYLENDISLTRTFNITTNKNIYGNGYTLDLNFFTVGLAATGIVANIENINLINQQIYSFFWSEFQNVTVNYRDVTSSGRQFIYLAHGTANLYGTIDATASLEENFQGGDLIIKEGANVDFKNTSAINAIISKTGVTVEDGAVLNVESRGIGMYVTQVPAINIRGEANFDSSQNIAIYAPVANGYMTIHEHAKLRATSKVTNHEAIMLLNGSLTVKDGATLEASSEGTESTIQTGNLMSFEKGSNFLVTNTRGPALGAYAKPTDVAIESLNGLDTWAVGNTQTDNPTNSYSGHLTAVFSLNTFTTGQVTSNLISNNPDFQANFSSGRVGRIAGGSFVKRQEIAQTTVNEVTNEDETVTGKAEPNAAIDIFVNNEVIASGTVDSTGNYEIKIPKQTTGTVILVNASIDGLESSAQTTVTRASLTETTISEITTTTTQVNGTGEPNASIEITVDGTIIANGRIGSDGKYSLTIPLQKEGTVVQAQATLNGLTSNVASTVVTAVPTITEGTITPASYNVSSGDQFLRGTYTGDVASARVYVNGSSVRGGNFADGSFEFFIGNRIQSVDDVVEIEALDQYGKVLDRTTVELTRDLAGTITPDQYRVGETMITGTFTGDVNFARLVINGTPSNAWGGTFNADGTFSFYVANLGIKAGDKVEIQALNRQINGNTEAIEVLETKEVTVIDQLQGTITPDKYNYTDTTITGTFTGDINFANLVIDGQSVGNWGGTFNKETGRFEFFVHAQFRDQIRTAAKVELQTYHRETVDGQTIDHKLVLQPVEIVKATGSIQPAAFKVTESEITGTFTGNVNFANLIVDGRSVSWGGTFNTTDQTFTYFVNQDTRNLIRDAETVELVAYHREVVNGRPVDTELDRSVVTIDKEFIGTITPDPYKLGDRTITGTYTGDDINFGRLEIDGMILWVSGFADGTFTAYLNQEQANSVTKDSKMTIHALHRFADLSTREIAQATVSITE